MNLLVEEKALFPRIVEVALALLEEQVHDPDALLARDLLLLGVGVHSLTDALVNVHVGGLVEIWAQSLSPYVLVNHEV